jgi:hypothetical protein
MQRHARRVSLRKWMPGLLMILSFTALNAWAAGPLEIMDTDSHGLTFRVDVRDWSWRSIHSDDGLMEAFVPSARGFVAGGAPGAPQALSLGRWIAVPPGKTAVVSVRDATWETLNGRLIAPVPIPVRQNGLDDRPLLSEEYVFQGQKISSGIAVLSAEELAAMAHESASFGSVTVGETQRWRGHRIAPLTVRPLEHDANGHALRRLVSATVVVTFVSDGSKDSSLVQGHSDGHLAGVVLNGHQMASWATEQKPGVGSVKQVNKLGSLLRPELRLPVTKSRLHKIEASRFTALGLVDLAGIEERHVRLYQRRYLPDNPAIYEEIEVPVLMVGDGGAFSGNDYFVFWGLRARDDVAFTDLNGPHADGGDLDEIFNPNVSDEVNSGNIYYLALSEPDEGQQWARMDSQSLPATGGTSVSSYHRVDYHEEDTIHGYQPYDEWVDRNHWNSRLDGTVDRDLDAVNPLLGRTDVRLRAGFVGLGTAQRRFQISLAGALTHDIAILTGVTQLETEYDSYNTGDIIQSDWLVDADFRTWNVATPTAMLGWLDWFEVSYEAAYAAADDELDFHLGDGTGLRTVEVTGFTDPEMDVFDLSDPRNPVVITTTAANMVDMGDGTWNLLLTADQSEAEKRRFLAVADGLMGAIPGFSYFKVSTVDYPDDPTDVVGQQDVLVITHSMFRAEAERWVAHRQNQSRDPLTFHVLDIHQIFDWFSGGLKNPDAIKRLAQYAGDNWDTWAIQIFGDAYQNVRGLGEEGDQRDWVPSRWHVWSQTGYANELLPADKWFVTPAAGPNYPDDTFVPPDMIIARFPCNSTTEATTMVDKVIAFETAEDSWKARSIWLADDAWSEGYQSSGSEQSYHANEVTFTTSQNSLATRWEEFGCEAGGWCETLGLESDRIFLADDLDPLSPPTNQSRNLYDFWDLCEQHVLPRLFSAMNQGGMMLHYQGHANDYQMAHERVFFDTEVTLERSDVDDVANIGRPWLFVGLGCHLAAWARDGVESNPRSLPSLGEKLLLKSNAGAVAVYASPGYEFLSNNATFAGVMGNVWLDHPPQDLAGPAGKSRWVMGELFLASEAELLALGTGLFSRRLVAQYAILGDGLMVLDAAPPRIQVQRNGVPLEDGVDLVVPDAGNELAFTVQALDEAGVDKIMVTDGTGIQLSATITGGTPAEAVSDQYAEWEVRVPVGLSGQDQNIIFHVYDTADASDDMPHTTLSARLAASVVMYLDGELFDPTEALLPLDTPLNFTGSFVTAVWIDPSAVLEFQGEHVTVVSGSANRVDEHTVSFDIVVEVTGDAPKVLLVIDGNSIEIPLTDEEGEVLPPEGISDVNVFPNPVQDQTSFLFRTDADDAPGTIHIYTLSGHRLASLPIRSTDYSGNRVLVEWDGRDSQGDQPANGVYLYRIELETPTGRIASDMKRLVMMH